MRKTLYILRHAKAEPLTSGQDDHDRPLAERGMREALAMGRYLMGQHIRPARVLCSTALRTRQTLHYVQEAYPQTLLVHYEEKLYLTSAQEMLLALSAMADDVPSLLLVGHNPGLHELCMRLVREDTPLRREMLAKFPTCAFAELRIDGSWADLPKAEAALTRFLTPEKI